MLFKHHNDKINSITLWYWELPLLLLALAVNAINVMHLVLSLLIHNKIFFFVHKP